MTNILLNIALVSCVLNEVTKFEIATSRERALDGMLLSLFAWFNFVFTFLLGIAEFTCTYLRVIDVKREYALMAFLLRITIITEIIFQNGFLHFALSEENSKKVSIKALVFLIVANVTFWLSASVYSGSSPFQFSSVIVHFFGDESAPVIISTTFSFRSLFRLQSVKMLTKLLVKRIMFEFSYPVRQHTRQRYLSEG